MTLVFWRVRASPLFSGMYARDDSAAVHALFSGSATEKCEYRVFYGGKRQRGFKVTLLAATLTLSDGRTDTRARKNSTKCEKGFVSRMWAFRLMII